MVAEKHISRYEEIPLSEFGFYLYRGIALAMAAYRPDRWNFVRTSAVKDRRFP